MEIFGLWGVWLVEGGIRIYKDLWKEKWPSWIILGCGPLILWGKFCTCAVALQEWPAHGYYTLHPLYWCPRPLNRGVRLIKVSFTVSKGKKIKLGTLATVAFIKGACFIEVSLYKAKAMGKLLFIMSNENCYQIRNLQCVNYMYFKRAWT